MLIETEHILIAPVDVFDIKWIIEDLEKDEEKASKYFNLDASANEKDFFDFMFEQMMKRNIIPFMCYDKTNRDCIGYIILSSDHHFGVMDLVVNVSNYEGEVITSICCFALDIFSLNGLSILTMEVPHNSTTNRTLSDLGIVPVNSNEKYNYYQIDNSAFADKDLTKILVY